MDTRSFLWAFCGFLFSMLLLCSVTSAAESNDCAYVVEGDLNSDCRVDFRDFALFAANWLVDCNSQPLDPACKPVEQTTEQSYLLIATAEQLPSRLETQVNEAGGSLLRTIPQIGVAVATSTDPNFSVKLQAVSPALQSVVPNIATNWLDPVDASVDSNDLQITEIVTDEYLPLQWSLDAIDAPEAWALGPKGAGVRIAVLDTGMGYDESLTPPIHPDLYPNINTELAASFVPGESVWNARADHTSDSVWHGMYVAGIIAAADNADDTGMLGVAPEAEIVPVKVLQASTGVGRTDWVIAGVLYAVENGADIINLSINARLPRGGYSDDNGTPEDTSDDIVITAREIAELVNAWNRAMNYANKMDVTVIAAAGNDALDLDSDRNWIVLPSQSNHVIAVAATAPELWALDQQTDLDVPASYTNYGKTVIDIAAPGGDSDMAYTEEGQIWIKLPPSPVPRPAWIYDLVLGPALIPYNYNWFWRSGTSAAAPHVSGVAALIISKSGTSMKPNEIANILYRSADDLGQHGPDDYYGHGRVNAYKAVSYIKALHEGLITE